MLAKDAFGARVAFVAIAVVALGIRLWHLDLITFGYDEAVLVQFAEDILRLGYIRLTGPLSSVGLSTPAHFIYLLSPIVGLSRDPEFVAAFLALANAGAVVATMVLAWRAFGPLTGLVAGLLFTVNPLAVAYSRRIWQPDVLPLLTVLLFLALDLGVVGRRVWWATATFPLAALAMLVHTSIGPLLPLLLAPAVMLAIARRWLHLLVGIGSSLLIGVPFVLYEVQTDWQDYPNFRYYSSLHSFVDLDALRWLLAVTTGWMLPNDGVVPAPQRVLPQPVIDTAAVLALALLMAGLVVAIIGIMRARSPWFGPTRVRLVALVLWIVLPVVLSIRHWQPMFLHYFFEVLPAASLLMAVVWAGLPLGPPALTKVVRAAALCATVVVATMQGVSIVGGLAYQAVAPGADPCFMTPVVVTRTIAAEVAQFGHAAGSTRAVVELDAAAAKPMAYLLRPEFPHVYLPRTKLLSQTPGLVGDVGLGSVVAPNVPNRAATSQPSVLTAAAQPELQYPNGVSLHNAIFTQQSAGDQHLLLAVNWSVDPTAASVRPVFWQIVLMDSTGQIVGSDAGDPRQPADFGGQRLVSWFWFDGRRQVAPANLAPGQYQLGIQLIDASATPADPLPFTGPNAASDQTFTLPVEMVQHQDCDLVSTIP